MAPAPTTPIRMIVFDKRLSAISYLSYRLSAIGYQRHAWPTLRAGTWEVKR
jgi:hypothetical protein